MDADAISSPGSSCGLRTGTPGSDADKNGFFESRGQTQSTVARTS